MNRFKFFPVLLALILFGCAAHNPTPVPVPTNLDHSITLTWNQSFANNVACSGTVTTSCISGFNEGYLSGTSQIQLHTDTTVVCAGTTQPESCTSTFNGLLPIGSVTFYVTTTYVNQSGVAGLATPADSPAVPVGADAATNVQATINN